MSLFDEKNSSFLFFFFLLLFLTYQTPKPDPMEPKLNAIGWFGVPSLQISFGAQYVKTEILGFVFNMNRTEPITTMNQRMSDPLLRAYTTG